MGGRWGLLSSNAAFRSLWTARLVSYVGDGIAIVALVLLVSSGRPATAVGGLLLARTIPGFLSPVFGALADRRDRRALMVQTELGQAVIYAVIAAWRPPYVWLLVLVALATLLSRGFSAASKSALPALVERDDLLPANALLNTVFNLQLALGPALGGLLVAASGLRTAVAIDAASFLASALIMLALPRMPPAEGHSAASGLATDIRDGLRFIWGDPLLRVLITSMFAFVAFASLDNVAVVFLVRDVLGNGAFAYGAAMSAFGLGMIAAALGLVRRWSPVHPATIVLVGMLFTGLGNLLVGVAPAIGLVVAFQALGGIGNGLGLVGEDTLLQRHAPEHMLGRVFGAFGASVFLGSTIAYAAGGVFVDATSPRTALIASGIAVFVVAALTWPALSRAAASDPGEVRAPPA
ncbi:MAG TPA: MFS transporter [Thermoleophilaceae bacterium]